MAVIAIDIPSGYSSRRPRGYTYVGSGENSELQDFDASNGKIIWYLYKVPREPNCLKHLVRRYYPVANLTRTRQAIIFDPYKPEKFFIRTFNATSLYILSVCEVCGSYQCPYCPYYSDAPLLQVNFMAVFTLILLNCLLSRFHNV